ncbi:MAG: flagellin [Acidobacteria bacterium]|nr:flagellin [Acidobacteriota bacterium]
MGLRINTNIPSVTALRLLRQSDQAQQKSLERLSTGLRINRASDDPSGLVISEQLRAQIRGMKQALENSQGASNLIGTTEAALDEVNSLLLGIRESVIFAMNTGGNDAEQIDAEQDSIDNAIRSIDRIAQTTKFATRKLLDGSSGIKVLSQAAAISDINVQNVIFDSQSQQQFSLAVTQIASQAELFAGGSAYGGAGASAAIVRVTGEGGTQDISIASSFTLAQFNDAINIYTADTGIYASAGTLYSVEYGSAEAVSVEVVSGTLNAGGGMDTTDGIANDEGQDVAGSLNGISFDAAGNKVRVVSDVFTGDIRVVDGTAAGTYTFTVKNSGLVFQLNQSSAASDREQIGISSVHSSFLGEASRTINGMAGSTVTIGGFLSSLVSGGLNDLDTNAKNALGILDSAINEVSDTRAYLGAFQAHTVDTNIASLAVAIENLTAAESRIRDLDFAAETTAFTRNQILYQAGIAVLAQSNLISQSVLTLLG